MFPFLYNLQNNISAGNKLYSKFIYIFKDAEEDLHIVVGRVVLT